MYKLFNAYTDQELSAQVYNAKSDRYKFNIELQESINRFKSTFGDTKPEILNLLEQVLELRVFQDRIKLICINELSKADFDIFIEFLPIFIKNYYNILGPERIKELSYRNDIIKAEYDKLVNNQEVESPAKEIIANSFVVGSKYSNSYIKARLKDIYSDIGLKKTAKAKDLEDYFETVSCNVQRADDPTKYDKGYLILSLKPSPK